MGGSLADVFLERGFQTCFRVWPLNQSWRADALPSSKIPPPNDPKRCCHRTRPHTAPGSRTHLIAVARPPLQFRSEYPLPAPKRYSPVPQDQRIDLHLPFRRNCSRPSQNPFRTQRTYKHLTLGKCHAALGSLSKLLLYCRWMLSMFKSMSHLFVFVCSARMQPR